MEDRIRVQGVQVLSDNWYVLRKTTSTTAGATALGSGSRAIPTTEATGRWS